jgi:HK97 family phage major capsid protein
MTLNYRTGSFERKDESGGDVKTAINEFMRSFEEFKSSNDSRLKEIEKKGSADVVLEEKVNKINSSLDKLEGLNQRLTLQEKQHEALQKSLEAIELGVKRINPGSPEDETKKKEELYRKSFDRYLRSHVNDVPAEDFKTLNERKALIASNDTLGGYYLAPAQMEQQIIKAIIEMSPMRSLATVTPIGVASLKLPKRTGTFAARRTTETATRTETDGYTTGMVEILAPEMYADVRISEQMLEDSAFNLESEMAMEISEQMAVKEGTEFISGGGVGVLEAEGILTASGVSTTNSGNATALTADGIISLFYAIKTGYAGNGTFIMNRQTLSSVRKLKETVSGNYLWQPGLANGIPNTLLGAPYVEMPDMPNEGAGLVPLVFGDFRRAYRVVDRVILTILRDPYTIAGNGQIKYLARRRVGGAVVLGEAIRKQVCST